MTNGISIDTLIKLYAYCTDFNFNAVELGKELRDKYDDRTRHGCYPIPYDEWVSQKLSLMRIDKGHDV